MAIVRVCLKSRFSVSSSVCSAVNVIFNHGIHRTKPKHRTEHRDQILLSGLPDTKNVNRRKHVGFLRFIGLKN